MSTDASSQQPPNLSSAYAQQMGVGGAPPHLASLTAAAQDDRSYPTSEPAASAPDSPAVSVPPVTNSAPNSAGAPVTKGKNGATGPAEGKPKPHVCSICQRGFTTGGHLQRHQRIHTGIKAFKCPYPGCETRTSRQDNLQQHYRTHLSPTLRRGSGTAARQAVAAAMMAAGLKSTTSRQPRKSKNSQVGTPGSSSGASVTHGASPYQTPTQGTAYGSYMYDPNQQHGYANYAIPPGVSMAQPQSAQSSRVPSPVNGHSSSSVPSAHHQQYFPQQQFSSAYAYPGSNYGQPYRYGAPAQMPSPYSAHPSQYYSQSLAPEHGGQQHMYSPLQTGFNQHPRDSAYSNIVNNGGYANQASPMGNGYPPRTQTSTPLSVAHDELSSDPRYRSAPNGGAPRAPSPRSASVRRLTPSHQADILPSSLVDPASMSAAAGQNGSAAQFHQTGASAATAAAAARQPPMNAASYSYPNGYGAYGSHNNKPFIKHE